MAAEIARIIELGFDIHSRHDRTRLALNDRIQELAVIGQLEGACAKVEDGGGNRAEQVLVVGVFNAGRPDGSRAVGDDGAAIDLGGGEEADQDVVDRLAAPATPERIALALCLVHPLGAFEQQAAPVALDRNRRGSVPASSTNLPSSQARVR